MQYSTFVIGTINDTMNLISITHATHSNLYKIFDESRMSRPLHVEINKEFEFYRLRVRLNGCCNGFNFDSSNVLSFNSGLLHIASYLCTYLNDLITFLHYSLTINCSRITELSLILTMCTSFVGQHISAKL